MLTVQSVSVRFSDSASSDSREHSSGERSVGQLAIKDISFTVCDREVLAILGPSGCGKTTLLRAIAGLEVYSGHIERPEVGMMFQDRNCFPWLTVKQNVLFGAPHHARADQALEQVGLADDAHKRAHQLSGGMRQRVALARLLVSNRKLWLLDEPFSALDDTNRHKMRELTQQQLRAVGASAVLVTHNVRDATAIATGIVRLSASPAVVVGRYEPPFEDLS